MEVSIVLTQTGKTEDVLSNLGTESFRGILWDSIWAKIESIIGVCFVPKQIYGADRPSVEDDFLGFIENIEACLRNVLKVMSRLLEIRKICESSAEPEVVTFEINRDTVVSILVLCGEHLSFDLWTTKTSRALAIQCLDILCCLCACKSSSQLLSGLTSKTLGKIFKQGLIFLRPKLLRETWQCYPSAVSSYRWMLMQVHSPDLSEYLNMVLPTALMVLDDYVLERRLIGLSCITHIISNVTRTELCHQGFHNVIYKALEHVLLHNEAEHIEPTIACLTNLMHMTERGYTRSAEPGMWDRFDDSLQTILSKMLMEDKISLRKAYIKSLGPLITTMGPSVIRWSKPLLSVLDEYLHKESFDTRIDALQVLVKYLHLSSPRLSHNGDQVLFLLLRTLYDVSCDKQHGQMSDYSITTGLILECFQALRTAIPNLNSMKEEISLLECNSFMKNILTTAFE